MNTITHKATIIQTLKLLFLFAIGTYGLTADAQSGAFTATLDVAGGSVVVGQPVTLDWYVTGGPANCTINNGVGAFSVTTDPEAGSISGVTPPANGSAFILSCTRGGANGGGTETTTDNLVVVPNPVITFTPEFGTDLVNGLGGNRRFDLDWSAEYATGCSDVTYTSASSPNPTTPATWQYNHHSNGVVNTRFRTIGVLDAIITETTTFSITCDNSDQGTQTTETITIVITDPPAPLPPIINVIQPVANPAPLTAHPVQRLAQFTYEFQAENSAWCTDYKAYNLHEYPAVERSLPDNYLAWQGHTYRKMSLQLGSSTVLTVRCGRDALTVGGIDYPATSTTLVKTFVVDSGEVLVTYPRAENTYATATITATPNPVDRGSFVAANIVASNVDYCNFSAYRMTDGANYDLPNWTKEKTWQREDADSNQDLDLTFTPTLDENTILEATCVNVYDRDHGTAAEQARAVTVARTEVLVTVPPTAAVPPDVWLYSGPSLHLTADDIWNTRTAETNMRQDYVSGGLNRNHLRPNLYWSGNNIINNVGSVTFTFNHPHGTGRSDVYNIHVRHCDESDGASQYVISTDRSGVVGNYVSDQTPQASSFIYCNTASQAVGLFAQGVLLTDGDEITIHCTANQAVPNSGRAEYCRFSDVYLGTGSGNNTLALSADPANPQTPLIWMSEDAAGCHTKTADTSGGTSYTWAYGNSTYGSVVDTPIDTDTTYSITCDRPVDGVETVETVDVLNSSDPDAPLVPEETTSDEATYNIVDCWWPDPSNTDSPVGYVSASPVPSLTNPSPTGPVLGQYVQAPDGFNSIPGIFVNVEQQCVPLVDLSVSPVFPNNNLSTDDIANPGNGATFDGVDNVNGTYDLTIIPYVQNLASVDLPAMAQITYNVNMTGNGRNDVESGLFNNVLAANTPPSTVPLTNMSILRVQFGSYAMEVRFNQDGSPNYPDSNMSNNVFTGPVTLPVPAPHMRLFMSDGRAVIDNAVTSVDVPLVRSGTAVTLDWSVNVNYLLNCTLEGPGVSQTLTLDGAGTGDTVGSNPTGNSPSTGSANVTLDSTSEFLFTCTEPATGESFSYSGNIEVVPNFQEF